MNPTDVDYSLCEALELGGRRGLLYIGYKTFILSLFIRATRLLTAATRTLASVISE